MFQIFIPGLQTNRDEALRAAGLGDLVPDAFWTDGPGPEGLQGAIAGWRPRGQTSRIGYYPEAQRWIPAVPDGELLGGRYWVGFWQGEDLGPGLLARRDQYGGVRLPLTDSGEPWLIPSVGLLPQVMRLTEQGLMLQVRQPLQQFAREAAKWSQRLCDVGQAARDGREAPGWPFREFFDYCAVALRLNYCLTNEVISELGIISTGNVQSIVLATLADGGGA